MKNLLKGTSGKGKRLMPCYLTSCFIHEKNSDPQHHSKNKKYSVCTAGNPNKNFRSQMKQALCSAFWDLFGFSLSALKALLIIAFCFLLKPVNLQAQQANPTHIGSVKGVLQDTLHKYTVKAATVALYRADSTLINYMLSNNYGEFNFRNLPLNASYYLEISHISYELLRKPFSLSNDNKIVDVKTIVLKTRDVALKEVKIKIPPISMNGDTLEFNPAAFKLDSNAVVEDLLRKIPNVTLWGDGQITVNGREVKSLLVNGKEFFGGDFKMATQNISKNALEKVQVYNTKANNENNSQDSSLTVNLKLKKGKDKGHFGKLGGGYGSDQHFEGDGNLNFYAPKMQLGFIAASNNTNKIANSIKTLTATSTYNGTGINVEYQPDFRASGLSNTSTGGATFSYNFIEKPTYNRRKELLANYFVQDRDHTTIANSQNVATTGNNQRLFTYTNSTTTNLTTNHTVDSKYNFANRKYRLNVSQNFTFRDGESTNNSDRRTEDDLGTITSTNITNGWSNTQNKTFNLSADYNYNDYLKYNAKIRNYSLRYSLQFNEANSDKNDQTTFRSFTNPSSNRDYNRKYNSDNHNLTQSINAELPGINRLIFGKKRLAGIQMGLSNNAELILSRDKDRVGDIDREQNYLENKYLTNDVRVTTINEEPGINIQKSFSKSLSNRFNRSYNISLSAKQKFVYQENKSPKAFQNINRDYSSFTPSASFSYYRYQYQEYSNNLYLNIYTDIAIPTIDQLAPLTDSSNVYRLQRGNLDLKNSTSRNISLNFYHYDDRGKNTLNYNLGASISFVENSFADSSYVNADNTRISYVTNVDGYRNYNFNGELRKALKLKNHVFQFKLVSNWQYSRVPGYVNEVFSYSYNNNKNANLNITYTFKGKFAFETREALSFTKSRQEAFNTSYRGSNYTTTFSSSYKFTKKFTLNSNISMNNTRSAKAPALSYHIWNASAIYRFMKGNNLELKLTALDLLHENNSIFNSSNDNGFTFSSRNVLQQYFMSTLSYYPRKFGKK